MSGPDAEAEGQRRPRPDERVPAEEHWNRRVERGRGQLAEPWVDDLVGEQEVAGVAILGSGPAALVRPEPRREEHAGVDERAVREPRSQCADGARPIPIEEVAEQASRRPAVRAPAGRRKRRRPEPALLDDRAGPGAGV